MKAPPLLSLLLPVTLVIQSSAWGVPLPIQAPGFSLQLPESMVLLPNTPTSGGAIVATTTATPDGFPTLTILSQPGAFGAPGELLDASIQRILESYRLVGLTDSKILQARSIAWGNIAWAGEAAPQATIQYLYQGNRRCSVVSTPSSASQHLILTATAPCDRQKAAERLLHEVLPSVVIEGASSTQRPKNSSSGGLMAFSSLLFFAVAAVTLYVLKRHRPLGR